MGHLLDVGFGEVRRSRWTLRRGSRGGTERGSGGSGLKLVSTVSRRGTDRRSESRSAVTCM